MVVGFPAKLENLFMRRFVQQLLGFVDLGSKVRAASSIGMVQEHDGSVGLLDLFLGDASLTVDVERNLGQRFCREKQFPPCLTGVVLERRNLLEREDQRSLLLGHLLLEAALVELAHGSAASSRLTPRNETGATLQ